ncbi:MAG TPA: hypothetical protein PK175_00430 [Syntrophales bacterium]|nr:hypothetical protein [Syntrophales bacterium]HOU76660.1 hypothetical protein [Syntrophales bacterium]HPC31417.1 hypothetical protein [Syntrophales bacterium]HQG33323.1 hypothetical protein [Syntrophales bacterium]HQI35473.1 hypothetical protein [Syntrophales bacterium]
MKLKYLVGLLIFFLPLVMGMSNLGDESPARIPVPEKKFRAAYIDQADTYTEVGEASIDGGTFLAGKRGEGTYTVAFENIHYIDFLHKSDDLTAHIKLRDGKDITLSVGRKGRAYGRTKYGTFQIRLADLKRMTILAPGK